MKDISNTLINYVVIYKKIFMLTSVNKIMILHKIVNEFFVDLYLFRYRARKKPAKHKCIKSHMKQLEV